MPVARLLYLPTAHATHAVEAVALGLVEYVPQEHASQLLAPARALYVPVPHDVHAAEVSTEKMLL